ncbi:LysR family transcriptional regulator [Chromobacterium sp. IIBBL 290-4]|uniref:LysR family transcriptional regulator n=1 Tax=Chromobacterium sp. IIBBL 290-4 TaxID=2953890 RepID=UPI0020B8C49F|nr:LysR family transcriptional regulator [Chromobacterium sp. IIBBL 290-4]UTH75359.1 LysR family transcriptional regulator [Chromobacterium sp. IIBBL 290-4]
MPSPDNLLAFDALARGGSFTAAADLLDCNKSLISARIKELEHELGAVLVQRTTRKVALTEAGERLRPHAARLRETVAQARMAVDETQSDVQGPLMVSTTSSLAQYVLGPVLSELATLHPGLQLSLEVNNQLQDPVADVLDFCLRSARSHKVHDDRLVARLAGYASENLYASPAYLARHPDIRQPADLAAHRLLATEAEHRGGLKLTRGEQHVQQAIAPLFYLSHYPLQANLALAGHGITLLADYTVQRHLDRGELVRVLPEWHCDYWPIYLVHAFRAPLTRKYQTFIDFTLPRVAAALPENGKSQTGLDRHTR